ncbi:thiamine phosphate synthase [Evansella cellulosilytica]|uniref:Thiamine-phosphate synthase n=1 Tax=Evansella cellulosilytica (strain ATCC 21833 / DSM 2522 / FERM P-1141 / JCM 9156 / N-4) TaxID=649639 RepID=E6U035_EVAC2|nr:thiamine phosphate synthase [Evansella cellulosilytica]ADU29039.1 thiamine-phosphate pyrophosphorylase [Evansella cellulosilytica DSM 2522]
MARINSDKMKDFLKVYFIAGSTNVHGSLPTVLQQAIEGGISIFQFREKGNGALTGESKITLARELQQLCQKASIPFIVNDDIDLAIELDADGVHIGQEDDNIIEVRKKIGDRILGVSAHTLDEAKAALASGADYLGVGPVFPTSSKADTREVCGPHFIEELRHEGIDAPIVAIGGINVENATQVVHGKADGLSVISAISSANDPSDAVKMLNEAWK